MVSERGSANAEAASSNETPCLARLRLALSGSHSKRMVSGPPDDPRMQQRLRIQCSTARTGRCPACIDQVHHVLRVVQPVPAPVPHAPVQPVPTEEQNA